MGVSIEFKKIYEHDIDFLIMEELISDSTFKNLFLDKLGIHHNYCIEKIAHSLSDQNGESDITLILSHNNKKIGVLIEDKIDAQTMPEQSQRYHKRAMASIERNQYDEYYVILVAPLEYINEHKNDINAQYEYKITYEELAEFFSTRDDVRSLFKKEKLEFAIRKKQVGYIVQENKNVSEFWKKLREYCRDNYPHLVMLGENTPKGASACWPEFRTSLGKIKIVYKSQKGYVDLEFPHYGNRIYDLKKVVDEKMSESMAIWNTGKSASIRISNDKWIVDFTKEFELNKEIVKEVLDAVSEMCEFASKLNYCELY